MSDTAIQHKRVKMGMSDTEISTFWGGKIQHFWASQEYNIYMYIQGSSLDITLVRSARTPEYSCEC